MDFEKLAQAMGDLDEDAVVEMLEQVMEDGGSEAEQAMEACQKGMDTVGKLFEEGEYFVGDLIYAGELMTGAVKILKDALVSGSDSGPKTRMILCTVKNDLHDIGKNIVKSMLEANGFDVLDLGIDVPAEKIVETAKAEGIKIVALSGPTHAEEVARDLPTTIVSACEDIAVAEYVQKVFTTPVMRVYTNTDVKGVEICSALKNIIALASGISTGLGYGDNTKAALITRGLAEMRRLGKKLGCLDETFSGLAGMGDLIVTATSVHSRNNKCGYLIGQGYTPEDAVKQVGMVVEGINAIPAAKAMAKEYGVEMPIVEAVDAIINNGVDPSEAVRNLMGRKSKTELI